MATDLQITRIKFVDKSADVEKIEKARIQQALKRMGDSINNRASLFAPVLTGALRSDGRVNVSDWSVVVSYGGYSVPYARRRHYENNKHPQTKRYLERAGNAVGREGIVRYL
jgi:hypothetical protein